MHTRHGAGDRAIGFDAASARFDHVLVSGAKIRDRLIAEAGVDPASISIVGYPKFDIAKQDGVACPGLRDDRPTVLYNPHVSPHLSSWYAMRWQVLEWFVAQDQHQLIFVSHVMLFERRFVLTIDRLRLDGPGRVADRYLRAPNIHVDLGSRASTDMTYTDRADIYLSDVSSQLCEFIARLQPCVFLNAHSVDWRHDENFAQWRAGPVIDDIDELGNAFDRPRGSGNDLPPRGGRTVRPSFRLDGGAVRPEGGARGRFHRGPILSGRLRSTFEKSGAIDASSLAETS